MASAGRPAKWSTKPSTWLSTALSGASSSASPGFGDRLVMMAERAQRQRAVAQDLAASRGILAGIDQRHVENLDRRGMVAQAVEGVAQHVAGAGLQRLQALGALLDPLVDIADESRSARARRRR